MNNPTDSFYVTIIINMAVMQNLQVVSEKFNFNQAHVSGSHAEK